MTEGTCLLFLLFLFSISLGSSAALRCFECTSYMYQCKTTVDNRQYDIYNTTCRTKCFVRVGEDHAIYRGCFDDFADVDELSYDYVGCRNQSWNNRQLPWCLCDTPFCNGVSMRHLGAYSGTSLNTARKSLGHERSGIFPNRVFKGGHVTTYEMKETSYGASYTGYVDRLKTAGRRPAARQDNSTEEWYRLDDFPSSPSRSADDVPRDTDVSKSRIAGLDDGAIYGQRLEQKIHPPRYRSGQLHNGRDELGRRYLRMNDYNGHGRGATRALGERLYAESRRTPAVNAKQLRPGVFDRNRSNQHSYEDTIYENVYDRRPTEAKLGGVLDVSTGGDRRSVGGDGAAHRAGVFKGRGDRG